MTLGFSGFYLSPLLARVKIRWNGLLGCALHSFLPVVRSSVQVGNSDDQDFPIKDLVDYPKWEPAQLTSTSAVCERLPSLREAIDALNGVQCFN
jgi:hypothetical protein